MDVTLFRDVPGQEEAKRRLRMAVDSGKLPHALMLSGPSGLGKMLLARAFMAYAHCENPHDGEPCGKCRNCRLHADIDHPDVHFSFPIVKSAAKHYLTSDDRHDVWVKMLTGHPMMTPRNWLDLIEAGNSQPAIHVEEAQDIIRFAAFPPYATLLKFFVIWLPERLRPEAANKLLKVIEEPSRGICFLLVSNNELEVLPTIMSRAQRIEVRPTAVTSDQALDREETAEFRQVFQTLMRDAYQRKIGNIKQLSESTAIWGREKLTRFFTYMTAMIRENFIYNLRIPQLNHLDAQDEAFSRNFSPFIHAGNVEEMIAECDRARNEITRNCNAKIVMFDFFLLIVALIRRKRTQ